MYTASRIQIRPGAASKTKLTRIGEKVCLPLEGGMGTDLVGVVAFRRIHGQPIRVNEA